MQLEIKDDYDREAIAAIFRALDAAAIAGSTSVSGVVHPEVRTRCNQLVDAIRMELMEGLAVADAAGHSSAG